MAHFEKQSLVQPVRAVRRSRMRVALGRLCDLVCTNARYEEGAGARGVITNVDAGSDSGVSSAAERPPPCDGADASRSRVLPRFSSCRTSLNATNGVDSGVGSFISSPAVMSDQGEYDMGRGPVVPTWMGPKRMSFP